MNFYRSFLISLFALGAALSSASATCFTVLSADEIVVYRSTVSPINLSKQIHETLPSVFPAGHMIIDSNDRGCQLARSVVGIKKMPLTGAALAEETNAILSNLAVVVGSRLW